MATILGKDVKSVRFSSKQTLLPAQITGMFFYRAAKIMGKSGSVITLEVMKKAAFYHGLAKLVEGEISLCKFSLP